MNTSIHYSANKIHTHTHTKKKKSYRPTLLLSKPLLHQSNIFCLILITLSSSSPSSSLSSSSYWWLPHPYVMRWSHIKQHKSKECLIVHTCNRWGSIDAPSPIRGNKKLTLTILPVWIHDYWRTFRCKSILKRNKIMLECLYLLSILYRCISTISQQFSFTVRIQRKLCGEICFLQLRYLFSSML